jgi:hypothetical protein
MELDVDAGTGSASAESTVVAPLATRPEVKQERKGTETLSRALGWFSVGLGLAQLVAPTQVARLAGAEPTADTVRLMRALGARELLSGVGILSGRHDDAWIRARVAGDVMDLALLGRVLSSNSSNRTKTVAATLAVAGVTALDVLAARRSSKSDGSNSQN